MIDRRRLLMTAAGMTLLRAPSPASAEANEAGRLNAHMDRVFEVELGFSPELRSNLGLDTGDNAPAKGKLDDRSASAVEAGIERQRGYARDLKNIDRARLSGMDAINYDTIAYSGALTIEGADRFHFGTRGSPAPYLLSQLTGGYQSLPDFLNSQHAIRTAADAEAYLARVQALGPVLDQETDRARDDGARGIFPPDFAIDTALTQLKGMRATPLAETMLVSSIVRRAREQGIPGDWAGRSSVLVEQMVNPALERQIALLEHWRRTATHDAGIWRLDQGAEYYGWAIRHQTTTDMSADDIHRMGLAQVAEISSRIDAILRSQGMTEGSVGERVAAVFRRPEFIYPNTEDGKAKLLADLNLQVADLTARLPQFFATLPRSPLEIRRVPRDLEAGAPGGYYQNGSLDGSRPGIYYINLRNTAEWPRPTLPTLTWHEGVPGHHFQISLALEAEDIPLLRRVAGFNAYQEGWALYAEQLADEMGVYDEDPFGRIGYLQSLLFRAVRLVVDSGLHHKRWSREEAIRYMVDTLRDEETSVTTEVERYCVWPGQACSYKVGHTRIVELRESARKTLGPKFDLRRFHDATLLSGALPLVILDRRITEWAGGQ